MKLVRAYKVMVLNGREIFKGDGLQESQEEWKKKNEWSYPDTYLSKQGSPKSVLVL